jgi:hypothetical protein
VAREPVPRAAFDDALRRLDTAALASLVADIWDARGCETRREGDRVVVERGGGPTTVHVHDGAGRFGRTRSPPAPDAVGADLVVTNVPAAGEGVRDAADLREALLYAVPPATGDELCRRHLGIPARRDPGSPEQSSARSTVVVLAVVVVLVAVALATGVPGGSNGVDDAGRADVNGTPAGDAGSPVSEGAPSPAAGEVAPGVGRNGSIDVERVADTHARVLAGTSYTWVVTYREYRNGSRVDTVRWQVAAAGPGRYNSTVTGDERSRNSATTLGETAYADGETRYERHPDGRVSRERIDAADGEDDPHVAAATRMISWYLSAENVSVGQAGRSDDGRHYVFAEDDPWPGTEAERTVAVVRDYGLVDSLHRRHRIAGTNTTVVVAFEYRATGATTVDEPAWVANATADAAANRT